MNNEDQNRTHNVLNENQQQPTQSIQDLINHLKSLLATNLKNLCLDNAIFFAEKILNLTQARMNQINDVEAQNENNEIGENKLRSPDAEMANELTNVQKLNYEKHYCHNQYIQSIYNLAYCFMLNKEYMRCINVIEKNDLIYSNEKFRVLTGQAYICSGRIAEAISVLEAKIHG